MKKIQLDILREIKKSMGRFLSIFAIVAIGVAFFAGIKASAPLMKENADAYFDDNNFHDIQLYSTLGFVGEDIDAIKHLEGIEGIHATHSVDTLFKIGTSEYVYKVMTLPRDMSKENKDYINQAVLVEGRLPENENECVIEYEKSFTNGAKIGDVLHLESGTDTPLEETLNQTELTVVGKVTIPYYLSYQKGASSIGNGTLDGFLLVFDDNFKSDIYTEVYLTVENAKDYNSYDDAYFKEVIDPVVKRVEHLGETRANLRTDEVKAMAMEEYQKGYDTFIQEKEQGLAQLEEAQKQLDAAKEQLDDADDEIKANKRNIETIRAAGEAALMQANEHLEQLKEQLAQADSDSEQVKILRKELQRVNDEINQIPEEDRNGENDAYLKLLARQQALELLIDLGTGDRLKEQLQILIEKQEEAIIETKIKIDERLSEVEAQIAAGEVQYAAGKAQYEAGVKELEDNRRIAEEKFAEAEEKLAIAKKEIEEMDEAEWIVLDRHSHYSYMDYGSAAESMDAIASIFPVFFFLVAALICLTTMTRMVDEQRGTIGTLKALGYAKKDIALRYLAYAFFSSVCGCVAGVFVGFAVFPTIIVHEWNMMYTLPDAGFKFYGDLALLASVSSIAITLLATYFAVSKELKETPALLMRPKAPSNGKRIVLERIPLIWNHLSFTKKVTCRNLFRYKKRFFMTVLGISGCTALLVAGFGIQDSIGDIVNKQYGELQTYDLNIGLKEGLNIVEREELQAKVNEREDVLDSMYIQTMSGTAQIKNKEQAISIVVVEDEENYVNYHQLRSRTTLAPIALEKDGILLSEKMAKDAGVKVGDFIKIDSQDTSKEFKVTGTFENYIGHLVIMNQNLYKSTYGMTSKPTNLFVKLPDLDANAEKELGLALNEYEEVQSLIFFSGSAESFADMIASLSIVVVVLVVSAGLLAFVVLYNLTNVNISERVREIATLKVLGFYDKEVSNYVFRENLLLTLIGALVGLGLGTGLHRIIMSLAELDSVMFGRVIFVKSYVISAIMTMVFAWIVAKVMHYKLKKIPMVESLKSVE